MNKIPNEFSKNGYSYTLLKRVGNLALYSQEQPKGRVWAYELHKVREIPKRISKFKQPDIHLNSPGNY